MPSDAFAGLSTNDSVAIAVWNTDAGAGDLQSFLDRELGLDCSVASPLLDSGASHFVLLIQEALRRSNEIPAVPRQSATPPPVKENPRPGERLGVVELAERCGLAVFYVPGARNGHAPRDGKREDKGEAILSTLPLSDFIAIELPYEAARRVVIAATIRDASGDSLRLASVHFISSPPPWRVLQTANSSRLRQALALVDALEKIELARSSNSATETGTSFPLAPGRSTMSRGISTIVAGDLNTWSTRETALRHMWSHFPESPRPLDEPTRGPFPTDHLLFRRNHYVSGAPDRIIESSYRRIDDPYYSDHHPIIAWYRFGRAASAN